MRRAGIDLDPRQRAAAARAVDHLAAGGRRTDVVLGADQQQRRHPRAPAEAGGNPAVRIERDRRAEIRPVIARGLRPHRPQQRAGPVRPSDQADAVLRHPGLLHQPSPRRHDVGHPLAAGEHAALLDAALRPEFARAVAVRQQHRMAGLEQLFGPVAVARQHRLRNGRPVRRSHAARSRSETDRRRPACRAARARSGWPRGSRPDAAPATPPRPRGRNGGAGHGNSVRNRLLTEGASGFGRVIMALGHSEPHVEGYHAR